MSITLVSAGFLLASALAAAPQDAPATAGPDLGGSITVGGVEIPEAEIKRFIIYGPARPALEYHRINALIHDQIKRCVDGFEDELANWKAITESGADAGPEPTPVDPASYEVSDEEFQKLFDKKISEFTDKYPEETTGLRVETEIARTYRSIEWYRRELRQEIQFDKVFIHDNTDNWPDLTFEALRAEAGEILIKDFQDSYERRRLDHETRLAEWKLKVEADDPQAGPEPEIMPEDSMYRSILRQMVRDTVYKVVDSRTAVDGLPMDMICTMDFDWDEKPELSLTTDQMWSMVASTVSAVEIDSARHFLALIEATRQRLGAEKKLMTEEESLAKFEEIKAGFQSAMFNLGTIAIGAHQFPSVESYADYVPLFESYKASMKPQIEGTAEDGLPAVLRSHLDRANQVMGLAKVDAEVLLVSAFDFGDFSWKAKGWEDAKTKAQWLKSEIEKNNADYAAFRTKRMEAAAKGEEYTPDSDVVEPHAFWSELINTHCEFWDPPPPEIGRQSAVAYKQLGRFGERTRNDLRSLMNESAYVNFLRGGLVTDEIFFEQPIGTVAGPFKGPWGYYLTKVVSRTPPTRPLNMNDERHLELLRDDWYRISFIDYAHEAMANAE
ncbi:MAG: hypothetical protein ABGY71_03490 [bacterium]|nr:hypothetical protein [Planctomycetota bacterium]HIL53012.1 hypothetical protein [Planctomycetota bacterium]